MSQTRLDEDSSMSMAQTTLNSSPALSNAPDTPHLPTRTNALVPQSPAAAVLTKSTRPIIPMRTLVAGLIASLSILIASIWRWKLYLWSILSGTLEFSLQVTLGGLLGTGTVSTIITLSTIALVFFTKAIKARRTPGHMEIHTSSVDLIDSSYDVVDEELRQPEPSDWRPDDPSVAPDKYEPERQKSTLRSPEDQLYTAFFRYAPSLDRDSFQEVFTSMEWRHLDAGEMLVDASRCEKVDGMYIVVEGVISQRPVSGIVSDPVEQQPVSRCRSSMMMSTAASEVRYYHSDILFIMAMLKDVTPLNNFVADTKSDVVCITRETFERLLSREPRMLVSFLRAAIARQWRVAHFVIKQFFNLPDNPAQTISPLWTYFSESTARHSEVMTFASKLPIIELARGQLLFSTGSMHRKKLMLLLEGCVSILSASSSYNKDYPTESSEVGPGAVFGGICFVTSSPHLETIRCLTPCRFACVSVQDFDQNPHPILVEIIVEVCRGMYRLLHQFSSMSLHSHWVPAGKTLFQQNDDAKYVYVVVSGRVRLYTRRTDGEKKTIVEIGRGECVGEMSFLAGDALHSYSCLTMRDSEIVLMPRASLKTHLPNHLLFLRRFSSTMASRLLKVVKGLPAKGSKISTIAIVPTSRSVDVCDFAERLTECLNFFGSSFHVNFDVMQKMLEEDDTLGHLSDWNKDQHIFRSQVSHFLSDLEESHDFLLFSGDRAHVEWSKCCIRQSDHIFIVGDASASPTVSQLEQHLLWSSDETVSMSDKDLVLIHSNKARLPCGTLRWYNGRQLHAHHHIQKSKTEHYERLARIICRRAVGLVCSGGGARGLAHMGTIQALHELHMPVDYICGTSQGAFMAALYALHGTEMEPVVRTFSRRMGSIWELLLDATLPVMSYFSGCTFSTSIRDFFGDTQIEDLWIPYFAVTTNLTKSDVSSHHRGSLWKAVRASMSIVDYLPPFYLDGDVHIDGGYIDNLPVDLMRDAHQPNTIVAVDVENKTSPFRNIQDFGPYLSGFWLLWVKIQQFIIPCKKPVKVPRFSEIVTSLSYLNNNRNIRHFLDSKTIDVYIRPELGQTLLLDYHKYDEIRELGYRFSKVQLVKWVVQNRRLVNTLRSRASKTRFNSSPDLVRLDSPQDSSIHQTAASTQPNRLLVRRSSGGVEKSSSRVSVASSSNDNDISD